MAPTKTPKTDYARLQQTLQKLQAERLQHWQQLRLGATTNVRKLTQLRRQIARTLTFLRQLELDKDVLKNNQDKRG